MTDATKLDLPDSATLAANDTDGRIAMRDAALRRAPEPGRLGVYSVLGGVTGVVPLPWVPDALARRVRGALIQDIADRHGVFVPRDARDVLVEPSGTEGPRRFGGQVARFVATKVLARFGPIALVPPVRAGLETFVLGHLFHRYLGARIQGSPRLDVVEARRVRHCIDKASLAALTVEMQKDESERVLPGDDRDAITALVDGILSKAAGVPAFLVKRLEAAFDELLFGMGD